MYVDVCVYVQAYIVLWMCIYVCSMHVYIHTYTYVRTSVHCRLTINNADLLYGYTILGQPLACVVSSAFNVFSITVCDTWCVNH